MQNDTEERTQSRRRRGWVILTASAVALAVISTTVYAQAEPGGKDDKAAVSGQGAAGEVSTPAPENGKSGKKGESKDELNLSASAPIVEWNLGRREDTSAAAHARSYDRMINSVRAAAGPVLRSDMRVTTQDESRYIIVRVSTGGEEAIDLYFQARNMYLIGWATHNDNENEAAFALEGAEDDRVFLDNVPDSVVLTHIPQDYRGLAGVARRSRDSLSFGRAALIDAVQTLRNERTHHYAQNSNTNHAQAAEALMTLIVGVAEAARFSPLSRQIHESVLAGRSEHLSARNLELINDWDAASAYAFRFTRTHEPPQRPLHFGNHQRDVHNWVQLAAVLALAHYIPPGGKGLR